MQKSKDARRKFYKFSPSGYVPKRAVSVVQLAMAGVAATLSCADLRSIPPKLNFKI